MGMDQEQTPHKRRVRYKGKYPRKFEEKYKELQPEKYADDAYQQQNSIMAIGSGQLLGKGLYNTCLLYTSPSPRDS